MQSTFVFFAALIGFVLVAGNPTDFNIDNQDAFPQPRNMFQQALINQLLNRFVPLDAQAEIIDVAAMFGLERNDFLLRSLKELQKLEKYAKLDLVNLLTKAIKFGETQITRDHQRQLEQLESKGIALGKLIFSNSLQANALNPVYDLVMKAVRNQINGQTVVDELPKLIDQILIQHSLDPATIG